jgi:hypothetical protein
MGREGNILNWNSIHGILTPYPWYIKPSLMVLWTPLFWQKWGGSIYDEGVQNTMTKKRPRGKYTIWYFDPGDNISYANLPRSQYTMGVKIPYDTGFGIKLTIYHIQVMHTYHYTTDTVIRLNKRHMESFNISPPQLVRRQ